MLVTAITIVNSSFQAVLRQFTLIHADLRRFTSLQVFVDVSSNPLVYWTLIKVDTGLHQTVSLVIMPRVICGDCHREFSDARYFTQHLNAKKNGACKYASLHKKRRPTGPGGLSIPIRIDRAQQKAISEGQATLDAMIQDDNDVFEFHDSSSDSESDNELLPSEATDGNDNDYVIDENEDEKEEDYTANNQTVGLQQFYEYVANKLRSILD